MVSCPCCGASSYSVSPQEPVALACWLAAMLLLLLCRVGRRVTAAVVARWARSCALVCGWVCVQRIDDEALGLPRVCCCRLGALACSASSRAAPDH